MRQKEEEEEAEETVAERERERETLDAVVLQKYSNVVIHDKANSHIKNYAPTMHQLCHLLKI